MLHAVPFLLQKNERIITNMRQEKALQRGLCIFIGLVIAILSLTRGKWQLGLLITAFAFWILHVAVVLLVPYVRRARRIRQHQKMRKTLQKNNIPQPVSFEIPQLKEPSTEQLLLMHVNHRISTCLRSTFGSITWEWCTEKPVNLITQGGTGRIKVFGIDDYDHADVKLTKNADISFDMIRLTPLAKISDENSSADNIPPNKQPVDPQIWYEVQGRSVLESVVADLNSRGHNQLILHENGDISILQDEENVVERHLGNFPNITYWPRLIQVLERDGLAAIVTDRKIVVSW